MGIAAIIQMCLVGLALFWAGVGLWLALTGSAPLETLFVRGPVDVRALGWSYVAQGILFAIVFASRGIIDHLPLAGSVALALACCSALVASVYFTRRSRRPRR